MHKNHPRVLIFIVSIVSAIAYGMVMGLIIVSAFNPTKNTNKSISTVPNELIDELQKNEFHISLFEEKQDDLRLGGLSTNKPFSLQGIIARSFQGSNFELGRTLDENDVYTRYYITYTDGADITISGIMNVPKGDGPFPVLILNHGYVYPPEYTNGRGLKREQDFFARRGYVVVHPDYRNHAESSQDDRVETVFRTLYTEDVINAVVALKNADLDFIDKDNIGMFGHSMGGGITLNVVSTKPDLVKGGVIYAPVSGDYEKIFNRWVVETEEAEEIYKKYGTPEENSSFWKGLSAETFYDNIEIPLQFHQGTADDEIPLFWTDDTVSILQEKGKKIEYYVYEDGPHEFIYEWNLFMERSADFFDALLK